MKFDGHRYIHCRWCAGRGCLACEDEFKKAYKAAFPEGPKPFATFDLKNPGDAEAARQIIGREALERAFGPDGGGVEEIEENFRRYRATKDDA